MLVGLTYDLRSEYLAKGYSSDQVAEFDSERTVEAIEQALSSLGHRTVRIGSLPSLVRRLDRGERWDLVFNIAEGVGGFGREAQVPALLDYFGIAYTFSDPLPLSLTLHKGMAKRVVRDLGLATPDFEVVESLEDVARLDLLYPVFAKPIAEGTGRGIGPSCKADHLPELRLVCADLLEQYAQPVLVEEFLPGRELTVGVVGSGREARALGVLEVLLLPGAEANVYSYLNKEECETRVQYQLATGPVAKKAVRLALAAWRGLGCRDAGRVDLRCDAYGDPCFLEANPLAGLHPEHSDLAILCSLAGREYVSLIEAIVASAAARCQGQPHWPAAHSPSPAEKANAV